MKLRLSTRIHLPPDEVWHLVHTPELLDFVAAPLVRFSFLEPRQETGFASGARYRVRLRLFGAWPFGTQWIVPTSHEPCDGAWPKRLRDNGYSTFIETWDHWITVEPDVNGGTTYTDDLEVKAGALTPLVWAFAQAFYRHRQRRWRALARLVNTGGDNPRSAIGLDREGGA